MIYFDEAGNSGDNLLDKDQPSYLLLSHDFSLDETNRILSPLITASKADELHFKNIKKYEAQRNALITCLDNELITGERVHYYVAHKEFMITIQIVDKLIETVFYYRGIDIYKEGVNLSTANILYIMGTNVWNRKLFDEMCRAFVKWVRSCSDEDCTAFYKAARDLKNSLHDKKEKALVDMILHSELHKTEIVESFEKYTIDATLSCFIQHCDFWAKRYDKPFDITFDNSKQINYWKDMIDFFTNQMPESEVGYGSRKHRYPLLINSLNLADSKDHRQLQLADVLASSLNSTAINLIQKQNDNLAEQIAVTRTGQLEGNNMWPTTKVTPEDLDMVDTSGQNALDLIVDVAMKNPEAYEKAQNSKT